MHQAEPTRELDKAYITLRKQDIEKINAHLNKRATHITSIIYANINRKYDAHLYVSCSGKLRLNVMVRNFFRANSKFNEKCYELDLNDPDPGLTFLQDDGENNFVLRIIIEENEDG